MTRRQSPFVVLVVLGIATASSGCALELPGTVAGTDEKIPFASAPPLTTNELIGRYKTDWGTVVLKVADSGVADMVGTYGEPAEGWLAGKIVGSRFQYQWVGTSSGRRGRGYFERVADGFAGHWGWDENEVGGGQWHLTPISAASAP